MTKLPSMPLYVDDYEADTAHLTPEEDGIYNRLMRRQKTTKTPAQIQMNRARKDRTMSDAMTDAQLLRGFITPEMHPQGHAWMREFKRKMRGGHPTEMAVSYLRGKDLCCWCPPDQPCHADVLLALANDPSTMTNILGA